MLRIRYVILALSGVFQEFRALDSSPTRQIKVRQNHINQPPALPTGRTCCPTFGVAVIGGCQNINRKGRQSRHPPVGLWPHGYKEHNSAWACIIAHPHGHHGLHSCTATMMTHTHTHTHAHTPSQPVVHPSTCTKGGCSPPLYISTSALSHIRST